MAWDSWMDSADRLVTASPKERAHRWKNPSWWNLLIFLPWVVGAAFDIYQYRVDRAIAARQMTATGVITVHDRPNHNQYRYTFTVEGKPYSGLGSPRGAEPAIGQQVRVYYDPFNPEKNSLIDFDESSSMRLGPVPLTSVAIGAGTAFIFFKRREYRRDISRQTR